MEIPEKMIAKAIATQVIRRIHAVMIKQIEESKEREFFAYVTMTTASKELEVPRKKIKDWIEKGLIDSKMVRKTTYVLLKRPPIPRRIFVDYEVGTDDDLPF